MLAVGDAAFQKKCLGKMEDVAEKEGRTVLFVSHNMQAVSQLTRRCIMLSKGINQFDGPTDQAMMSYLLAQREVSDQPAYYEAPPNRSGNYVAWARIHTSESEGFHRWGNSITFEFALNITEPQESICFAFQVVNAHQENVCHFLICDSQIPFGRNKGLFLLKCNIPHFRLYMGLYTLTTWLAERRSNRIIESIPNICSFEISMEGIHRSEYDWQPKDCIYIEDSSWSATQFSGKC